MILVVARRAKIEISFSEMISSIGRLAVRRFRVKEFSFRPFLNLPFFVL